MAVFLPYLHKQQTAVLFISSQQFCCFAEHGAVIKEI